MKEKLAETIAEALANDGQEYEIRNDYSGRAMYNKTTYGIVCENIAIVMESIINNAYLFIEDDDPKFSVSDLRYDSMGLGVIIY